MQENEKELEDLSNKISELVTIIDNTRKMTEEKINKYPANDAERQRLEDRLRNSEISERVNHLCTCVFLHSNPASNLTRWCI